MCQAAQALASCVWGAAAGGFCPPGRRTEERKAGYFKFLRALLFPLLSAGDFLLLSLPVPPLPEGFPNVFFFLDAPFTLLCFQQLPTLYVHALFLLLK